MIRTRNMRVCFFIVTISLMFGFAGPAFSALLILNEYNAVRANTFLNGGDEATDSQGNHVADTFFGRIQGNGGDWFELVVVVDHLDIRGWRLEIFEGPIHDTTLEFTQHPIWSDLRSGTIITVSEQLPDDVSYDPAGGDWWINVRAKRNDGTHTYITADDFKVNNDFFSVRILAANGALVYGPAGEGISPTSGVNRMEVMRLEADPGEQVMPESEFYKPGISSTFGAPNKWDGGTMQQDFSLLQVGITGQDEDRDGIFDEIDNCRLASNADQRDTDHDGIGNLCDPDLNNDGIVNRSDWRLLNTGKKRDNPNADLDGDGIVTVHDRKIFKSYLFKEPGPGVTLPDAPEDPTLSIYDPQHIIDIFIQMAPEDWDKLRAQQRSAVSVLGGDCMAAPNSHPFTWFSATVELNGQSVANVGVRKKGFLGSLDRQKPSLKLHLDRYSDGQHVSGINKLTLNNSKQDPSFVRQCLGYALFTAAGIPAPRCNFAHVYLNDEDLGIYVNVEQVRRPFLARHFDDNSGNLYDGDLSDFHPDWVNTFRLETNRKLNNRSDIDAVVAALQVDDEELLAALDRLVDLDAFMTYWVMEALIGHYDGYTSDRNNILVYHDPISDKMHFIPWGIDVILQSGYPSANPSPLAPISIYAYSTLSHRLYQFPSIRADYATRAFELLDFVWEEGIILTEVDRMKALIEPVTGDLSVPLASLRDFVITRESEMAVELSGAAAIIDKSPEDPLCLVGNGNVKAGFNTLWGTFETVPPFQTGSATIATDVAGFPNLPVIADGAVAGPEVADPNLNFASIQLVTVFDDSSIGLVHLNVLDPSMLVSGAAIPIDGVSVEGFMTVVPPGQSNPTSVSFLDNGVLLLDKASTVPNGEISGHVEAESFLFVRNP